ncbi:DMT family transporter [Porphyromonas sp.]|uniref:DMT family transporter n=1 Tax=Porphyromonas sp. TaxID=1924944 RepID=UPI0026DBEFEB|nr:DMT family transporter [Porphyromonas sp.]MDO4695618.1 DMT family transporter [Porphyromonas sp.]MDO4770508.1 DMT family transporter [Porphyromonas sp.]
MKKPRSFRSGAFLYREERFMDTVKNDRSTTIGYISAIVSACTFGFIPLFVLPLFHDGYSATDVLVYRTLFCSIGLAVYMLFAKIPFTISWKDVPFFVLGGIFYFCSAWFLLIGYTYISSGLATTIHFSYPFFVALILLVLFGKRPSFKSMLAILLAVGGVASISMFSGTELDPSTSFAGIAMILFSGFTYAAYIVELKHTRLSRFPGFRTTLYVMFVACVMFCVVSLFNQGYIQPLRAVSNYTNAILLALVPTIVSNLTLIVAVKHIGSSKASVLGALEPLTALVIGVMIFGESLSIGGMAGVVLILLSVYLVIRDKQ